MRQREELDGAREYEAWTLTGISRVCNRMTTRYTYPTCPKGLEEIMDEEEETGS